MISLHLTKLSEVRKAGDLSNDGYRLKKSGGKKWNKFANLIDSQYREISQEKFYKRLKKLLYYSLAWAWVLILAFHNPKKC